MMIGLVHVSYFVNSEVLDSQPLCQDVALNSTEEIEQLSEREVNQVDDVSLSPPQNHIRRSGHSHRSGSDKTHF
jgi:hypothetical protein